MTSVVTPGVIDPASERLIRAVQDLSLARTMDQIMDVVRFAAREIVQSDGASFVLREGDDCYYAEENAIAPLWKGQRFPLATCIGGWVMLQRQQAIIPDISVDDRIPQAAYEPTFVKSLVMTPVRRANPLASIGAYWSERRQPTETETRLLQALADTTAVAMENVAVYQDLERRVQQRTEQLEAANRELETFAYAVSHDLRAPLRAISGFSDMLMEDHADQLNETGHDLLERIQTTAQRMRELVNGLLELSKVSKVPVQRERVDLSLLAHELTMELRQHEPDRVIECHIEPGLQVEGDAGLLRQALENLLSNAFKYSRDRDVARIALQRDSNSPVQPAFLLRDNGAGFDMAHAGRLFAPFQRLHSADAFPGSGVGLATVQRIIRRHGGQIRAHAAPDQGAVFHFTLPEI